MFIFANMASRQDNIIIAGAEEAALIGGQQLRNLIYKGRLNNTTIINGKNKDNPYLNKINLDYTRDEARGVSSLGTPVYSDLTLQGCVFYDEKNEEQELKNDRYRLKGASEPVAGNSEPKGMAFYMNIETVLITVNKPINIIKTKIQGRSGTIKEYIGSDDAQLTISGVLTGKNGVYPHDEVARLKAWLDAPVSKEVTAWWLVNMGIDRVVVESYNFPQVEGGYSYQTFNITASSDLPAELIIDSPVK